MDSSRWIQWFNRWCYDLTIPRSTIFGCDLIPVILFHSFSVFRTPHFSHCSIMFTSSMACNAFLGATLALAGEQRRDNSQLRCVPRPFRRLVLSLRYFIVIIQSCNPTPGLLTNSTNSSELAETAATPSEHSHSAAWHSPTTMVSSLQLQRGMTITPKEKTLSSSMPEASTSTSNSCMAILKGA